MNTTTFDEVLAHAHQHIFDSILSLTDEHICEDCDGTGWTVQGQYDDVIEVPCHCSKRYEDPDEKADCLREWVEQG